jgi:hypothetical protein
MIPRRHRRRRRRARAAQRRTPPARQRPFEGMKNPDPGNNILGHVDGNAPFFAGDFYYPDF